MSSTQDCKFEGWAGIDDNATKGGMVFKTFTPKTWDEDDIDGECRSCWVCAFAEDLGLSVKVLYCGICGSDVHALSGDWGALSPDKPSVCGHEIVGEVVRVGGKVTNGIKLGDHVGIGAQSDSCRECKWCLKGE